MSGQNIQYRVPNEQDKDSETEKCQTAKVDNTSAVPDVAFDVFLLVRVWVVQVVVFFYIFGEQ